MLFCCFYPHPKTFLNCVLEREEGRERNVNMREKEHPVASCMCLYWELDQQPRYVPLAEIKPISFWLRDNAATT